MKPDQIEILKNSDIPEAVRIKIAEQLFLEEDRGAERSLEIAKIASENKKLLWNTPVVAALAGLLTLSATFLFDRVAAEDDTDHTITLTQLQSELANASAQAARDSEARLTQLQAELAEASAQTARDSEARLVELQANLQLKATESASTRSIQFEEIQFSYKIIENLLSKSINESERAKTLLFLARSGVLKNLNAIELERMATITLVRNEGSLNRSEGIDIDVGVPTLAQLSPSVDVGQLRPLPEIALRLIERFEYFSPKPYNDPSGYCTIGYGHLLSLKRCEEVTERSFISEEEALRLLAKDTEASRRGIQGLVEVDMTEAQFAAIISFVFNVGLESFTESKLLKLINEGNWGAAAQELKRWVNASGRTFPGLVARRNCEAAVLLGQFVPDAASFDVTLCASSKD